MRNGKFGCAVWGCGWVASGHINAYLKHPACEIVGLGSRSLSSVEAKQREVGLQCRVYDDFDQILNDPTVDIISICTPNNQHASEAIRAAQAGKHIFVEKPIAINADDIPVMLDAVASNHVHSLVAFILRFKPLVKLQRKLVSEGELGKVFMANVDYWFGRERKGWMKHKEQTGGAFILAGCHSVDMARFILDSDIVEVTAANAMVGDYYEYPPVETAQVKFANGALGVFTCSLVGDVPYTANLNILGEYGTIVNDQFYLRRFAGQKDFFTLDTGTKQSGDVYDHPFPEMVEHLVECIREDKESPHNLQSAVNSHLACIAICTSAQQNGRKIVIEGNRLLYP
ncbi:MAG: Gfo/Idh/MocA family oxidoreductase [Lentisphaerae bacterium]|jgi:predicted dehydrogenase|nr:Gfo/Idh/MocA family oxidoreductase [Lentisphaerota bacterium]